MSPSSSLHVNYEINLDALGRKYYAFLLCSPSAISQEVASCLAEEQAVQVRVTLNG